jgi:glycerate 2-kinase
VSLPARPWESGADSSEFEFLRQLFRVAVSAVSPAVCLRPHLPGPPPGRTLVIGAGKAAAAMARVVEEGWDGPLSGIAVTRYGHGVPCRRVQVVEAGHPLPDTAGLAAAVRVLGMTSSLTREDLVLCLLSGGGSALLPLPAPGLTLEDKQLVSSSLLRSGATIAEMNCVRKHLSAIKGGRLGAACFPARVVTLAISDVPGDDPSLIASGPTTADPTTYAEALAVLARYRVEAPTAVREHLEAGAAGARDETPKPGDARLACATTTIVARARDALAAAARAAEAANVAVLDLGSEVQGEACTVAAAHAEMALRLAEREESAQLPCVLLSGGETTVTVRGEGRGGRNTEYLLALALALQGRPGIYGLAADTDGVDGTESNAGAFLAPNTLARARAANLDSEAFLSRNDSFSFFSTLGDLLVTGPTRTNVNDFRALLVLHRKAEHEIAQRRACFPRSPGY